MDYRQHFNRRETPQSQPIPGETMVRNNAGGYAFQVDRWIQLERFLILGSEGGSYYVQQQPLTVENCQNVLECVQQDGSRVVKTIVEISQAGRAPKNDPALFVLAMCSGMGDENTRQAAFAALPQVARIGTHILQFAHFMEGFRGWGRAAKRGVGAWFLDRPVESLAYQHLKYAQRQGWSLRDLLRLTHPTPNSEEQNALFNYIVKGEVSPETEAVLPSQLLAARALAALPQGKVRQAVNLIAEHRLPREAVPNHLLNRPEVWQALLEQMPLTAMIRNLGKMTQVGLLAPLAETTKVVCERLSDEQYLRRARIHPINVLAALLTYQQGRGFRGGLSWSPVGQVVDALDAAFYGSFHNVEPSGKNILIGLDVSGSMGAARVNGMPFLTPRVAAAAMCLITARTEPNCHIMAFSDRFVDVTISPRQRLDDVIRATSGLPFGRTDCALPMLWALKNRAEVDAFQIYTDNETWYGKVHPVQALERYRRERRPTAKSIVCAMVATQFSIQKRKDRGWGTLYGGDPERVIDTNDPGSLEVAGLDSAAPAIVADFLRA